MFSFVLGRPKGSKNQGSRKRVKDPNRPKRPTSAYFYFAAKCREDNAKKGIKITRVADFTKEVSAKWNVLPSKEKEPYEKLAAKDKQRYDAEVSSGSKYTNIMNLYQINFKSSAHALKFYDYLKYIQAL